MKQLARYIPITFLFLATFFVSPASADVFYTPEGIRIDVSIENLTSPGQLFYKQGDLIGVSGSISSAVPAKIKLSALTIGNSSVNLLPVSPTRDIGSNGINSIILERSSFRVSIPQGATFPYQAKVDLTIEIEPMPIYIKIVETNTRTSTSQQCPSASQYSNDPYNNVNTENISATYQLFFYADNAGTIPLDISGRQLKINYTRTLRQDRVTQSLPDITSNGSLVAQGGTSTTFTDFIKLFQGLFTAGTGPEFCYPEYDYTTFEWQNGLNLSTPYQILDIPQCRDGYDNDTDGLVDTSDPQCHTDGNPANSSSYDPNFSPELAPVLECSDNTDNDYDGRKDQADPGCHTDGNASNDSSFNPADNSEIDVVVIQCSDTVDNDLDGLTDSEDPDCHRNGDINSPYNPDDTSEFL